MVLPIIIALLALFSLISYLLGTDEPRRGDVEPEFDALYLMRFAR
jgi:hypothetical protein